MFASILQSLAPICLVFEFLVLFLSYYLKDSRIFFITLALLCARTTYLYANFYQVHLFVSLFLPFVFLLFVVMKKSVLVFEKKNLAKIAVLVFVGILALFLTKSTNFNASMGENLFQMPFFSPISDVSFVFFVVEFLFLLLWGVLKGEPHFAAAFVLVFLQFLFADWTAGGFFEFASLFFLCYLLWHTYKSLYFDTLTKLPNQKALKRMLLGLKDYTLAALKIQGLNALNSKQERILLRKIAKILKKQDKSVRVFCVDANFVFVFKNSDERAVKEFLSTIKQGFDGTKSLLKDRELKLNVLSAFVKNQARAEDSLEALRAKLNANA